MDNALATDGPRILHTTGLLTSILRRQIAIEQAASAGERERLWIAQEFDIALLRSYLDRLLKQREEAQHG